MQSDWPLAGLIQDGRSSAKAKWDSEFILRDGKAFMRTVAGQLNLACCACGRCKSPDRVNSV